MIPHVNLLLLGVLLSCSSLQAQISDSFSDGNFSAAPSWSGDTAHFTVNAAGELQLLAPDAGVSRLWLPCFIPDSAVWECRIRLDFSPSASNRLRIYVQADDADLESAHAYFLEIGETGAADAPRFYRQDGGTAVLLATGVPASVATEPVDLRLRLLRRAHGRWTLETASSGNWWAPQFEATDSTYGSANGYFGFQCLYTAGRRDKFFFDDVRLDVFQPDSSPPVLVEAKATTATRLRAYFSEPLDSAAAANPQHYAVAGFGPPTGSTLLSDRQSVELRLDAPLPNNTWYELAAYGIADLAGNAAGAQTVDFLVRVPDTPERFDMLINEIMADPEPPAGLPPVEWIELFNRSGKVFNLKEFSLDDGGAPRALPDYWLLPGDYVALTGNAAALQSIAPNAISVPGFVSLNNDADVLTLRHGAAGLVDRVAYREDWHTLPGRSEGGWSLERRNPNLACLGRANWQTCPALSGGTPGAPNASLETSSDTERPRLLGAYPLAADTLQLRFSEGMDPATAVTPVGYRIDPPRQIAWAAQDSLELDRINLVLSEPLAPGIRYGVWGESPLSDCSGNAVLDSAVTTALPQVPERYDVVINEILPDPSPGGARFLEFFNNSNKVFDWRKFRIYNRFKSHAGIVLPAPGLFFPGEYAVFTRDTADIAGRYALVRRSFIHTAELPSMDADTGNLTLYWVSGNISAVIDSLDYSDAFHNSLLPAARREGVSLERIRADAPTQSAANWTSAATTGGGLAGTPTRPNSQAPGFVPPGTEADWMVLSSARFSPDGDGYEDYLDIHYNLEASGMAASVGIYDSGGMPVKRLARQELAGRSGWLRWDGDSDRGERLPPGIYVVVVEMFGPDGAVRRSKRAVALVKRL